MPLKAGGRERQGGFDLQIYPLVLRMSGISDPVLCLEYYDSRVMEIVLSRYCLEQRGRTIPSGSTRHLPVPIRALVDPQSFLCNGYC
jgi:hypothetical protein